jgi:hypothetical protein
MPLPITIPNTFANATATIPLSQLDNNFSTVAVAVNSIGNGAFSLANVQINGGTIANVTLDNVSVDIETLSNITITNLTVDGNATFTNAAVTANVATITTANVTTANVTTLESGNVAITGGTINVSSVIATDDVTVGDDLIFTGTGNRITGDFSNATLANRVMLQTSTTNGNTILGFIPNGTSVITGLRFEGSPAAANNAVGIIQLNASEFKIDSQISGTASFLPLTFFTGGIERMRVDTSGNVGIGTSSPVGRFSAVAAVDNTTVAVFGGPSGTTSRGLRIATGIIPGVTSNNELAILDAQSNAGVPTMVFQTAGTERARITSGGYFKASNTGTYSNSTSSYHEFVTSANEVDLQVTNTNATASAQTGGVSINYSGAAPNNTVFEFLRGADTAATRFTMRSNGGLLNYQANDVNLSDRREKTNFAPAGEYLSKICAISVQTFNYIDQAENDPGLTLGVVAQDVQEVAPELVTESDWGTAEEPKMRLSIYQTDLQYALMKCIQELKAELDATKAKVAALEEK